ncbi:MAG: triphosphoribosyl-dephospho-CoA synthase [Gammaproteobacteria bacterium]|nr:triphosphoribosyl-dephospho-CoA synthase [Gammaproteobacteria bacterium]
MIPVSQYPAGLRKWLVAVYQQACWTELKALKPGNVHCFSNGHGMTVEDFVTSADVSADPLTEPAIGLGERIFRAVAATHETVGCNTNLGILMLCAPLIQALLDERLDRGTLREKLSSVLRQAGAEDTRWLFRAIELAAPGGLGRSVKYDVRQSTDVRLFDVMSYAAGRDLIACQYVTDYANIFDFALPQLRELERRWQSREWAASGLFLHLLARFPDSHIQRKYGLDKANEISRKAAVLSKSLSHTDEPEKYCKHLLRADIEFKRKGINPGTSADLTVATLFISHLELILYAFDPKTGYSRSRDSCLNEVGVQI